VPVDLATLLVQDQLVPADAMERAVLRQRVCGGTLDTAILELDLLDEPSLVDALARASDLPAPPPPVLADPNPRIRRVFPARLAERHQVAPFRLDGRDLTVLAAWPTDLAAVDEVSAMLALRVAPHVAPEWRVRELNYRVYGTPLGDRFATLAARAREREAATDPLAFEIDVVFELPPAPTADEGPPGWTLDEARAALASAGSRDEVVRTALRYARDTFEYAAFLVVGRDGVRGHDALGAEGARDRARDFGAALEDAGVVRGVLETGAPQLRRLLKSEPLLVALSRGEPHTTLLQPVRLRGRVAALLYADNGEVPVSPARVRDYLVFSAAMGAAFERILKARKGSVADRRGLDAA
jgi:hypothetical protein